eukprot:c15190_g1_i1.p1 GENE.c15190_g1_i1~~c15190_g1_i1.p1  ORF type:complete len:275 (+),score=75.79 c15190_g1_i1:104-928(+)
MSKSSGLLTAIAKKDPCHCFLMCILGVGFFVSMCGLAAIPVGDIRFELHAQQTTFNATYPTENKAWKGERVVVEFVEGVATTEYIQTENGTISRGVSRSWGSFIPGLKINLGAKAYQPINEWKVVPEEMPLMWIAPMWCFLTGLLTLLASHLGRRDLLLNALVLVSISTSLLLIAAHRVVELTYLCSECDSQTKHMTAHALGRLPDGVEDPDLFADNNCPVSLHTKCQGGRNVYLAGGVINLVVMYLMFGTIEARRYILRSSEGGLAGKDSMRQ